MSPTCHTQSSWLYSRTSTDVGLMVCHGALRNRGTLWTRSGYQPVMDGCPFQKVGCSGPGPDLGLRADDCSTFHEALFRKAEDVREAVERGVDRGVRLSTDDLVCPLLLHLWLALHFSSSLDCTTLVQRGGLNLVCSISRCREHSRRAMMDRHALQGAQEASTKTDSSCPAISTRIHIRLPNHIIHRPPRSLGPARGAFGGIWDIQSRQHYHSNRLVTHLGSTRRRAQSGRTTI